jgi:ornithine carbamoyltransferase
MCKHLLSLWDIQQSDYRQLIQRSVEFSTAPATVGSSLKGKCVGLYFQKTSTRTRTSFAVAAARLGATPLAYGPGDLQIATGESVEDTAHVLSGYLDALVVRMAGDQKELRGMAANAQIPVINAMSSDEHPTQALSDVAMLKRHFDELNGVRLLYLGEGNNTAAALALAVSRIHGMEIELLTPPGYGLPAQLIGQCDELSRLHGGRVVTSEDLEGITPADAVYTTRWQTTGTTKSDPRWRESFGPYRVTAEIMARAHRPGRTVFMHDLPAVRGEDSDSAVLDGPNSIAFVQAQQKLFTAMAVLEWSMQ